MLHQPFREFVPQLIARRLGIFLIGIALAYIPVMLWLGLPPMITVVQLAMGLLLLAAARLQPRIVSLALGVTGLFYLATGLVGWAMDPQAILLQYNLVALLAPALAESARPDMFGLFNPSWGEGLLRVVGGQVLCLVPFGLINWVEKPIRRALTQRSLPWLLSQHWLWIMGGIFISSGAYGMISKPFRGEWHDLTHSTIHFMTGCVLFAALLSRNERYRLLAQVGLAPFYLGLGLAGFGGLTHFLGILLQLGDNLFHMVAGGLGTLFLAASLLEAMRGRAHWLKKDRAA